MRGDGIASVADGWRPDAIASREATGEFSESIGNRFGGVLVEPSFGVIVGLEGREYFGISQGVGDDG